MTVDYQHQVSLVQSLVTLRLQQDASILNAGSGLLAVNPNIDQPGWTSFYQAYNLKQNYPGIDAVSFSQYLTNDNLPNYLSTMTASRPGFSITPVGVRSEYAPVTYVAAISPISLQSIGYDPLSNPVRGAAMLAARDSGAAVMSGEISLVAAHKGQPAFIIYKAVYSQPATSVAARRLALKGYVFSAVNVADMMNSIDSEIQNSSYAFQIFDGNSPSLSTFMYQTNNFAATIRRPIRVSTFSLSFDSHSWSIKLAASGNIIPPSERQLPWLELFRGVFVSLFVVAAVWYLITDRERKLTKLRRQEIQATKDDLLTLASHQLRTPSTIVKQHIGVLLQNYGGKITKHQRNILNTAYAGNQRQLEIINQFLDVARLDAGHFKLDKKLVNLNKLMAKVVAQERKLATKKGQRIVYKPPKTVFNVMADQHYLQIALENLVSNASKYTPRRGKITITIRKVKTEISITVEDTGIGMTSEDIESIFDKFTRIDNDLTADANGSGVGLYLTKQIIMLHGGSIGVQSTPNKGSKFTVRLKLEG